MGARPGSSRRCSRRGRSPATAAGAARTSTPCCRWCGRRPTVTDFVDRRAGDAPPGRGARARRQGATGSSSSGRAGCATSSSRVQLLQLVHGRSDETLRSPQHADGAGVAGDVGLRRARGRREPGPRLPVPAHARAPDPAAPAAAHPRHARRTTQDLRRLGRSMGFTRDPAGRSWSTPWQRQAREVRRLHEKLFYRPLLDAVARLAAGQARLTPEAARDRLDALGFRDPAGALRHIEALTTGVSRRAAIQRTLLPVMLGWFADAPDPDAGLLGVPPGQRRPRQHPLVPAAAARRGGGGRAAGPRAGQQPVRRRAAAAGSGGRARAGRRGGAAAAAAATPCCRRCSRPPSRLRRPGAEAVAAVRGRARVASCSGSRPPTCSVD